MKKMNQLVYGTLSALFFPLAAMATPSTTYWAPSTASCQAWATPHITYDTYSGDVGSYPTDLGLTTGFLPYDKIQGEIGFDYLSSSIYPLYFNGKLCTPESSLFAGTPGLSFGIYNVGTKKNFSDYNVIHLMAQKSLPFGGYIAVGVYRGLNKTLFTNSTTGKTAQDGIMVAAVSPDIQIGLVGLKKVNFAGDIQTGKNILGAWGVGTNLYFTDTISLLTGPVFFLDESVQPGGEKFMWTAQLDIDVSFSKEPSSQK